MPIPVQRAVVGSHFCANSPGLRFAPSGLRVSLERRLGSLGARGSSTGMGPPAVGRIFDLALFAQRPGRACRAVLGTTVGLWGIHFCASSPGLRFAPSGLRFRLNGGFGNLGARGSSTGMNPPAVGRIFDLALYAWCTGEHAERCSALLSGYRGFISAPTAPDCASLHPGYGFRLNGGLAALAHGDHQRAWARPRWAGSSIWRSSRSAPVEHAERCSALQLGYGGFISAPAAPDCASLHPGYGFD